MKKFQSLKERLQHSRESIVEQCAKCKKIEKAIVIIDSKDTIIDACKIYISPKTQWRLNEYCQLSTEHRAVIEDQAKKKLNPIKKSKRRA